MDDARLEYWVIQVLDQVVSGEPNEDSRVELKSDWPSPEVAARRIAGHANASRGESVLWIIGADEKGRAVEGASAVERSAWFSQVQSHFEGISPSLHDLVLHYSGATVVALLFDTGRAPFVTKNPSRGKPGCGPVSLEVPWREATAVRSARREDLIRLFVPLLRTPELELLGGEIRVFQDSSYGDSPIFESMLDLYVAPRDDQRVVVPTHKAVASLGFQGADSLHIPKLIRFESGASATLSTTPAELVIDGPGRFTLMCYFEASQAPWPLPQHAAATYSIGFASTKRRIVVRCNYEKADENRLEVLDSDIQLAG